MPFKYRLDIISNDFSASVSPSGIKSVKNLTTMARKKNSSMDGSK